MRVAPSWMLLPLVACGCGTPRYATVHGHRVERPSVGYSDGARFAVQHRRAFPDVLSGAHAAIVDDGRITGRACGLELDFDASWHGSHVELTGRVDVPWHRDFTETEGLFGLSLDIVEPAPGRRHIVGRLLGKISIGVDIDASPERLVARINRRTYTLAADGDFLVGRMHDLRSVHEGEPPREVDIPTIERGDHVVNGFSLVRLSS